MKKRKQEIAKFFKILLIPLINICMIIVVSVAFAKPIDKKTTEKNNEKEKKENERMISVYFHNSNETKEIPMEEYLMGVVPAEMPPSFESEALKAQAVAARTFIINREKGGETEEHKGAAVCTDFNHCKAYVTEEDAVSKWGTDWNTIYKEKIRSAVYGTKGEIVTYENEPISAVFHSTSSGKTENSEDVWQTALPYLRSVISEGENQSPRYTSSAVFNYNEFKNIISAANSKAVFNENPDNWIGKIDYNESGSVKNIEIGGVTFKGTDIRTMFSLRSTNFNIITNGNIVFNVTGNGHGVGMSQYGANYAAKNGYTYDKILKKYYQGTEIEKLY